MESQKKSNSQKVMEAQAVLLHDQYRSRSIWTAMIATWVGVLLSFAVSAASFSSFITSVQVLRNYVLFLVGILGFQTIVVFVIWTLRKRNHRIVKMKESLIEAYLSAINRSGLNPHLTSSEH